MADRPRAPAALSAAARLAEDEYLRLERELQHGLDEAAIRTYAETLTEKHGDARTVIERAYLPTGVALGCPLADEATERIASMAREVERRLGAPLAHVPAAAYHITVVNRAHYEHSAPEFLSPGEFERVRRCIAELRPGAIEVAFRSVMITAYGKLLLTCTPVDDRLLELRTRLVEAVPALGVNVPKTAHLKLAHLLVPARAAVDADPRLDRLIFHDIYTPHGRIPLC